MADKQQPVTDDRVGSNPMNLTCKPVNSLEFQATTTDGAAPKKFAIVMNYNGPAQPPDKSWTINVFTSNEAYELKSTDGSNFAESIPVGGFAIYGK